MNCTWGMQKCKSDEPFEDKFNIFQKYCPHNSQWVHGAVSKILDWVVSFVYFLHTPIDVIQSPTYTPHSSTNKCHVIDQIEETFINKAYEIMK